MGHPLLATFLGAVVATALGAQPPADTGRADSARARSAGADTAGTPRPNPRLRPRPAAPVPRRPEATAGSRLAPAGATPAAAAATPARRRPIRSGTRVRKDSAAARDGTRRP